MLKKPSLTIDSLKFYLFSSVILQQYDQKTTLKDINQHEYFCIYHLNLIPHFDDITCLKFCYFEIIALAIECIAFLYLRIICTFEMIFQFKVIDFTFKSYDHVSFSIDSIKDSVPTLQSITLPKRSPKQFAKTCLNSIECNIQSHKLQRSISLNRLF